MKIQQLNIKLQKYIMKMKNGEEPPIYLNKSHQNKEEELKQKELHSFMQIVY